MDAWIEALIALVTLTSLEIVLGIDNIVFIAIVSGRLPEAERPKARQLGLLAALVMRILLLMTISWVMKATFPIFSWTDLGIQSEYLLEHEELNHVSIKDLILLGGGLFLIWKSVGEIHEKLEHEPHGDGEDLPKKKVTFWGVILQIMMLDIIFSLDSVITAVGMVKGSIGGVIPGIYVMIAAVIAAVGVMITFANPISNFVERHPTLKMLALSFLILIGVMLVAEGTGAHFDKGYVYFAMAFALIVEMLNLRMKSVAKGKKQAIEESAGH
ncbi:TerC family protein [Blastopirellula sp. JC732]|uniref:TerC family protein n=1 Tax=Blastopirellula sediminis TaxID=2894196 RepID=A0A9X1SK90_9BACT|nr:TerC family protein [Blastopirellula sediminis]MCC9607218.1 TerC family protein [Blastopirellula sediminis]MCC9629489.1 TerC family protein [Blastopirellula sediminis]